MKLQDYLIDQNNCYHLHIKLTPNAKFDKIDGTFIDENNLEHVKIYTTAIPEDNKANKQLIKIVSKALKVPKTKISLFKGDKSRLKTLKIEY
jgi:uncharacterized protein (TIGR00251 family)